MEGSSCKNDFAQESSQSRYLSLFHFNHPYVLTGLVSLFVVSI